MKGESFEAAERRWRGKSLFRKKRANGWHIFAWLVLLTVAALVTLFAISRDAPLFGYLL
jgi:hypothetical protein